MSDSVRKGFRVRSVILDGFKSYAHRQQLSDMDPHFNAITGQNGSGKSNIFDALCFVMGITNWRKMRATDKRELIFKNGNAGIQSAHVVLEFTNDDPATAPPGYPPSDFPIITVGRKVFSNSTERYFFNEKTADAAFVKRFFCTIHLNVDNPHFMVLQGEVHKLVSMKPADILGLLEEAAGTTNFDRRRKNAEMLIKHKERRIEDVNRNITQEIAPRLESKKQEQEQYNDFQRKMDQLATRKKFKVAHAHWTNTGKLSGDTQKLTDLQADVERAKLLQRSLPDEISQAKSCKERLDERRTVAESLILECTGKESENKKKCAKLDALITNADKELKKLEREAKTVENSEASHVKRVQSLAAGAEKRAKLQEVVTQAEQQVDQLKESLRLHKAGVTAGMSGMSLAEDQSTTDKELVRFKAEIHRAQDEKAYLAKEATTLAALCARRNTEGAGLAKALETATHRLEAAKEKYAPFVAPEAELEKLTEALSRLKRDLMSSQQEYAGTSTSLEYDQVACPGVENCILGRLGELVTASEPKFSKGLSAGVGNQNLYRVIVTTDTVAEQLITKGKLKRTSFLPLNKVRPGTGINANRMASAVAIAKQFGGEVHLAKDLIRCDAQLSDVVASTFGNFVICNSIQVAKALAFSDKTKMRAVTVDGDSADPKGTMTGGSLQSLRDTLKELNTLASRRAPLAALSKEINDMLSRADALRTRVGQGAAAKHALHEAEDAFLSAQQRVQSNNPNANGEVEANVAAVKENAVKLQRLEQAKQLVMERKEKLQALVGEDPRKVEKEINLKLTEAVKNLKQSTLEMEAGTQAHDEMEAEVESRSAELAQKKKDIVEDEANHRKEREGNTVELNTLRSALTELESQRRIAEADARQIDTSIQECAVTLKKLTDALSEADSSLKQADSLKKLLKAAMDESKKSIAELENMFPWIKQELPEFGLSSGRYYFEDVERTAVELKEIEEHEAMKANMQKKFTKCALIDHEDVKKDYDRLVYERNALIEDRGSIASVITIIETRKWETLNVESKKVSLLFSQLFSMCLPGASACLVEERNGEGHITGLEVKVAFNGKEKESLTELSGGQRSLLALCLILAILRLNPAPIYILDEVDAALDPSHTQNIGAMLQMHFSDAQFLLISLKDGMFNNANVLFEIRNTQGFSEINRRQARKK